MIMTIGVVLVGVLFTIALVRVAWGVFVENYCRLVNPQMYPTVPSQQQEAWFKESCEQRERIRLQSHIRSMELGLKIGMMK